MFTANFNIDYTDAQGVKVATGYASLNSTIDTHLSVIDRQAYEANKASIDEQEAAFRAKVLSVADIMGIANSVPKETEPAQ